MNELTEIEYEKIKHVLIALYVDTFLSSTYELSKKSDVVIDEVVEQSKIEQFLLISSIGLFLKDRIEQTNKLFVNRVMSELVSSATNQKAFQQTIDVVAKKYAAKIENTRRVLQTERSRAENLAKIESMQQAKNRGITLKKRWVSSLDSRTRKSHRRLDGETIDINEYFRIGSKKAKTPGDFGDAAEDCNCRCTIVSVVDVDDSTKTRRDGMSTMRDYQTYAQWEKQFKK